MGNILLLTQDRDWANRLRCRYCSIVTAETVQELRYAVENVTDMTHAFLEDRIPLIYRQMKGKTFMDVAYPLVKENHPDSEVIYMGGFSHYILSFLSEHDIQSMNREHAGEYISALLR